MTDIQVRPLVPERADDYLRFFDKKAFSDNADWSGCYCYFPYHDPKGAQWEKRPGTDNRAAMHDAITNHRAQGYLAYLGDEVVGWCNAAPRALYPAFGEHWTTSTEPVGLIVCFVVAPSHRGQGIARALLGAACHGLRSQGIRIVQAKPSRLARGTAENFPGPLAMYLSAGFHIVQEDGEGSVLVQKNLV